MVARVSSQGDAIATEGVDGFGAGENEGDEWFRIDQSCDAKEWSMWMDG